MVVTARRTAEDVIDVPIAIESYSAETLKRAGATGLRDLAAMTPGLSFQDVNGAFAAPIIRGMQQTDRTSLQGNVGVFVDGVYINNRAGLEFGLLEIERIEVDKGPQSALYGRNTFSGAINYISAKPDMDEVTGSASFEIGDHDRRTYQGGLSAPIMPGIAAVRVFGGWSQFDGTIKNLRSGDDIGGYKSKKAYGAQLLIEPTDKLSIRLYASESKLNGNAQPLLAMPVSANNCGATAVRPNGTFRTLYCGRVPNVDAVNVNDTVGQGTSGFTRIFYGALDYELPFGELSVLLSDETADYFNRIDTAANPLAISTPATAIPGRSTQGYITSVTPDSTDKTVDVRLSSLPGGPLRWMVGFYGYSSNLANTTVNASQLLNDPNGTPIINSSSGGRLKSEGRSFYGLVGYEFNEQFSVTAETRYTDEEQSYAGIGTNATVTVGGVVTPVVGNQKFDFWAPRFTASYKFTPDMVAYGSIAKGVKTGGFNSNGFLLGSFFSYKPETNWSYELGFKSNLMENRLRLTAAAFYIDWSAIQGQRQVGGTTSSVVTNLGGAKAKGVELSADFALTSTFTIRAAGSYTDPKYNDGFIDGDLTTPCGEYTGSTTINRQCSIFVGGNQMARTSKYQGAISGNWEFPEIVPGTDGYLRADYSYQSKKYSNGLQNSSQGAISLLNARAGFIRGPFEFAIWSKNLLDRKWVDAVVITNSTADGAPISGITFARIYPGERRTIGARLDYRF